jgi:hypothetical protein
MTARKAKTALKPSTKRKPATKWLEAKAPKLKTASRLSNEPPEGELLRHILPAVRTSKQMLGVPSSRSRLPPVRTLLKLRHPQSDQDVSGGEQSAINRAADPREQRSMDFANRIKSDLK